MTSSVDTDEAEVVDRLELTHLGAVHGVSRQRLGVELGGAVVSKGIRDVQVAEPIADKVGVASPRQDSDTRLNHRGEGRDERAGIYSIISWSEHGNGPADMKLTVTSGKELGVDTVRTLLVSSSSTNRLLNIGTGKVGGVGLGRVGIIPRGADVVRVKVGARVDDLVNVGVAGVVGLLAVGVISGEAGALVDEGLAARRVGLVEGRVLGGRDELAVRVVVGKLNVGLVLDRLVVETVVDSQSDEVELLARDAAAVNGLVLRLNVVGELGAVVTAVALGEDAKVTALILRELSKEGLEELPDKGSCVTLINDKFWKLSNDTTYLRSQSRSQCQCRTRSQCQLADPRRSYWRTR